MEHEEINIELLEAAARKLVAEWPEDKFNMRRFIQEPNGVGSDANKTTVSFGAVEKPFCSTAACFAGAMPWLDIPGLEVTEEDTMTIHDGVRYIDFVNYSLRVLGTYDDGVWAFIFGDEWPNDKREVLGRVLFLKHHGVPEAFIGETYDDGCGPVDHNAYDVSYKEFIE